jgi:hypothetical protein
MTTTRKDRKQKDFGDDFIWGNRKSTKFKSSDLEDNSSKSIKLSGSSDEDTNSESSTSDKENTSSSNSNILSPETIRTFDGMTLFGSPLDQNYQPQTSVISAQVNLDPEIALNEAYYSEQDNYDSSLDIFFEMFHDICG